MKLSNSRRVPSQLVASFLAFVCLVVLPLVFGCGPKLYIPPRDDAGDVSGLPVATMAPADQPDTPVRTGEDWPAFLGPRGDGTSLETGIDPELWQPHPPLKWSIPLGTSYGAPTVLGDRVLQFDRHGSEERLSCFDIRSGQELWRWNSPVQYEDMYNYNNGPRCSPVIDDGRVYTYGVSGQLSCVNLEDGRLLWSKNLVDEYNVVQNFFGVASTPYIYKDRLLVMVGGSPADAQRIPSGRLDLVKPDNSAIVAFDKVSGNELYRLGDDLASYASMTVRELHGRPVGLAFLRSGLIGFDPEDGQELFSFEWRADMLESVNAAMPVTDDNRILLSETYAIGSVLLQVNPDLTLDEIRRDSGSRRDLSFRAHWSTPIVVGDYLYGCSGRNQPDCDFRCIRFSDGEVMWKERRHERSSVALIDGFLIVLGENGLLELVRPTPEKLDVVKSVDLSQIVSPTDGTPLLNYPCWAAPVISRGNLLVRGRNHLLCFDLIPARP